VCQLLWVVSVLCLWVLDGFLACEAEFQVGLCAIVLCGLSALIQRCRGKQKVWMEGKNMKDVASNGPSSKSMSVVGSS